VVQRKHRTDRTRYRKQRACKEKYLMTENKKIWSCFNNEYRLGGTQVLNTGQKSAEEENHGPDVQNHVIQNEGRKKKGEKWARHSKGKKDEVEVLTKNPVRTSNTCPVHTVSTTVTGTMLTCFWSWSHFNNTHLAF
jgi:hypothetical protein